MMHVQELVEESCLPFLRTPASPHSSPQPPPSRSIRKEELRCFIAFEQEPLDGFKERQSHVQERTQKENYTYKTQAENISHVDVIK